MRVLYIGQHSEGTTSRMRSESLKMLLGGETYEVIDTHIPFFRTNGLYRRLGFRFKKGPLIHLINDYIIQNIHGNYDLIWVDKAVFITKKTTQRFRAATKMLVHYTPDAAFDMNRSQLFESSLSYYDYLVTTKSFELDRYKALVSSSKIIWVPQGFDKRTHHSTIPFDEKELAIVFIGLCEPSRELMISSLLNAGFKVYLAGKKWTSFAKNHPNSLLCYLGEGLFGQDYTEAISKCKFGWGAISKRFPELHTTRSFEIPACGTALLTEANAETSSFFAKDEAIFYHDEADLIAKINHYSQHKKELEDLTNKGHQKVINGGFDYDSILKGICNQLGLLVNE